MEVAVVLWLRSLYVFLPFYYAHAYAQFVLWLIVTIAEP
jgi:hypothetical protein